MGVNWINSTAARRAIGYLTDPRPAWLWSGDGKDLIWSNPAARLFRAKEKKHGLKLASPAVPIKGQVTRLIRLGAKGRSSLSRLRFLVGKKPVSATCTCTPLTLDNGTDSLLLVGVDPIDAQLMADHAFDPDVNANLFGNDISFVVLDGKGALLTSSADREQFSGDIEGATTLEAGPGSAHLHVFSQAALDTVPDDPAEDAQDAENLIDEAQSAEQESVVAEQSIDEDAEVGDKPSTPQRDLSSLVGQLAEHDALYEPLGPQDDAIPDGIVVPDIEPAHEHVESENLSPQQPVVVDVDSDEKSAALWKIIGAGFEAKAGVLPQNPVEDPSETEQVSRYNFEELSRILTDRVSGDEEGSAETPAALVAPLADKPDNIDRSLVNLSDETLVLNRLPLGILIFRDQEVLFANRALTDLVGYENSARLRAAGLSAIFPESIDTEDTAGPITHLAQFDGDKVPVTARLQSITWRGQSALMLSAREDAKPLDGESSVKAFIKTLTETENTGFMEMTRSGMIKTLSGRAAGLLGRTKEEVTGRPLLLLANHNVAQDLREFLEKPAKYAETPRPSMVVATQDPSVEILVFSGGQAGIVSGYYGIVHNVSGAPNVAETSEIEGIDPAILSRLSRGMRRPLNTIIGFSELIRSEAFGPIDNARYTEYASDVKGAGQEMVDVIDELDQFVRLNTGAYELAPANFDLSELLEACVARIRPEASRSRVLVRSAVSEQLPGVRADAKSLEQAILNLLASAIEQTPQGGQVVLSAHREDDGSTVINVKDSGRPQNDLAERFVVFRDGVSPKGETMRPVHSSVGLALTRSLLAVNTCTLDVDTNTGSGTLLSLTIPSAITVDLI